MKSTYSFWFVAVISFILAGCANTSPMPINQTTSKIDTSDTSIILAKVIIENQNVVSHQPDLQSIHIENGGEEIIFTEPTLVNDVEDIKKEYLVSLSVTPGKVKINHILFIDYIPLVLMGTAHLPLEDELDIPANSIVYVGNIHAIIKDNENDLPSAGSDFPLIDQSVCGFSSGTFEVDITDNFDDDLAEFAKNYPFLKDKKVIKSILPVWTHPERKAESAKTPNQNKS